MREHATHRDVLKEAPLLQSASRMPESEFALDVLDAFHPPELDRRWTPALREVIRVYGAWRGASSVQLTQYPCTCSCDREDVYCVQGPPLGSESTPSVLRHMHEHFVRRFRLHSASHVPQCWVLTEYSDPYRCMTMHTDSHILWDAERFPTDIMYWSLGAPAVFKLALMPRTALSNGVAGPAANELNSMETAGLAVVTELAPGDLANMSGMCQRECLHGAMSPSEGSSHSWSVEHPHICLVLRNIRNHDLGCVWNPHVPAPLTDVPSRDEIPCGPGHDAEDAANVDTDDDDDAMTAITELPDKPDRSLDARMSPVADEAVDSHDAKRMRDDKATRLSIETANLMRLQQQRRSASTFRRSPSPGRLVGEASQADVGTPRVRVARV